MHVMVRLLGGLGNQMFQYAAGRALADRHGVELKLDLTAFESCGLRRYELGAFTIRAAVASPEDIAAFEPGPEQGPEGAGSASTGAKAPEVHRERSFSFDAATQGLSPPVRLEGYWQSERYFAGIANALRRDFSLRGGLGAANRDMLARIGAAESVSVHVRRGDYVSNPATNGFHGVLGIDYYLEAAAHVAAQTAKPHFFVFSDDQQWAADNLDLGHPTTFVQVNDPDHGYADMHLMSACRHHIIANSSFSWWGAWLGVRPGAVVAPKRWFNQAPCDTRDLFPRGWTVL